MSKAIKLEYQIKAICRLIEQGKCKNVYSSHKQSKEAKK